MSIFERIYMTLAVLQDRRDRDDKGAAMVEYGLLVAFIAVVVGVAVQALGTDIAAMFDGIAFP